MSDRAALRRRAGIAFRVLCVVVTVGALVWFLRSLDSDALLGAFARASPALLVLAVALNLAGHMVRAQAWVVMLGPRHAVPYRRLLRYEFAAQAASAITPARAGEVLRLWLLKRHGVPIATTTALIAIKKLLGGVGLVLLAVWTPFLLPELPGFPSTFILAFTAFMLAQLAVVVVIAHRVDPGRLPRFLRGLVGGLDFLRDSRRTAAATGVMVAGEAIDAAAAVTIVHALDIDLSAAGAVLVLFSIDFYNMLPVAPGHLGTFEVGALYGLDILGVDASAALAFALLFHAQQVLPQIVVGLPLELRLLIGSRRVRDVDDPVPHDDPDRGPHDGPDDGTGRGPDDGTAPPAAPGRERDPAAPRGER